MSAVTLQINGQSIAVYPLVTTRAVATTKVVCRHRRTWAINSKGRIFCSDLGGIRKLVHRWEHGDELSLSDDDVFALGALGVIDGKTLAKIKSEAEYRRDFKHRKKWIEGDVESVRDAGIALEAGWKAKVEAKAHAYAKKRQTERRKRAKLGKAARAAKGGTA